MIDLVRKRHDGDGWIVVEEAQRRPGSYNSRRADAIALSVWASKKYEAHLYEFKESREDVKREIRDPSKVEGVGKYCTYWWLCVRDEKVIEDLVIPEAWGILVVHTDTVAGKQHRRLKVMRKAPKQKPELIDVLFAVSIIRNIRNTYADPVEHRRLQEENYQLRHGPKDADAQDIGDLKHKISILERDKERMADMIKKFEAASGVDLGSPSWEYGSIGEAVGIVRKIRERQLAQADIHQDVARLSKASEQMESRAAELAETAVLLRSLMASTEHRKDCASLRGWNGRCDCGVVPLSKVEREIAAAHDPKPAAPDQRLAEALEHERAIGQ